MGLLKKIFKKNVAEAQQAFINWIRLTNIDQIKQIRSLSKSETVFIFKHSTRCGISRMVMKQFEDDYDTSLNIDLFYLDLLNYRDISNEIESKFQVVHESPQIIIIKNGIVVTQVSHGEINNLELNRLVM